jgi:curved DNA-binding protein CbpA
VLGGRKVTVMAPAGHGGPGPDLYQLLGVPREASQAEIALAWRRQARAEHPDARPGDASAPGRFRALAGAWQVLGDPARRAAYDRVLARERQPADRDEAGRTRVPIRRVPGPARPGGRTPPLARAAEPALRAGPVRVDGFPPAPRLADGDDEYIRRAVLAALALRYLAADWRRPW